MADIQGCHNSKCIKVLACVLVLIRDVLACPVFVVVFMFSLCAGYTGKLFALSGIDPLVRIGKYLKRHVAIEAMIKFSEIIRYFYVLNTAILIAASNKQRAKEQKRRLKCR